MNRNEYILNLKYLRNLLTDFLGINEHDYTKGLDPEVITTEIVYPLIAVLEDYPKGYKSACVLIQDIISYDNFNLVFLVNNTTEELREIFKKSEIINKWLLDYDKTAIKNIWSTLIKEFKKYPKLEETSKIAIIFNRNKFIIIYLNKNKNMKKTVSVKF